MADAARLPRPSQDDAVQRLEDAHARAREDLFAALAHDCLPALRAYARSLTGDPQMADDCVQDAFVRALAAFGAYDTNRPFHPWIFRILRNEWLQRLRRDKRLTHLPDEKINAMLVDTHTPEDAAEGASLLAQIARLPPDMANAITLVLGQGFSYDEAAALCHCAPGTMKSRVSRARAVLMEQLEDGSAPKAA